MLYINITLNIFKKFQFFPFFFLLLETLKRPEENWNELLCSSHLKIGQCFDGWIHSRPPCVWLQSGNWLSFGRYNFANVHATYQFLMCVSSFSDIGTQYVFPEAHFRRRHWSYFKFIQINVDRSRRCTIPKTILLLRHRSSLQTRRHPMLGLRVMKIVVFIFVMVLVICEQIFQCHNDYRNVDLYSFRKGFIRSNAAFVNRWLDTSHCKQQSLL